VAVAVVKSRALAGMHAPEVVVEAHLANGLPAFTLVGLPETEVKEARDRVRAAIQNARYEFPARRITVNLAPADLPKESGRFDLPIALAILAASGQIPSDKLKHAEFAGELALTGELRPVRGALAMALATRAVGRQLVLPVTSASEAALATGLPVWIGISVERHGAKLTGFGREDQDFEDVAQALAPLKPDVISIMHTSPNDTDEAIDILRKHWKGPIGAYPESGYFKMPEWTFVDIIPPDELVAKSRAWKRKGVTAFGGCCGLGPEHISALSEAFKS